MHGSLYKRSRQLALINEINSPAAKRANVLVIRAAADEASGLLISGQLAGWLSTRLLQLSRPDLWGTIVGIGGLATAILTLIDPDNSEGIISQTVGAVATFLMLLSIGVTWTLFFTSMIYGFDGPAIGLFAFVSAESAPPGNPDFVQIAFPSTIRTSGLAHSSLYEDREVIRMIVEYIGRLSNS
jgi:hypothetical protein